MGAALKLEQPDRRLFEWKPRLNISTYELALCVPLFSAAGVTGQMYDALPEQAKRHFVVNDGTCQRS